MPAGVPPSDYSSVVLTAQYGSDTQRAGAIEHIIATHWKVLYKYLRLKHGIDSSDAEVMMRRFLTKVQEKGFLDAFDGDTTSIRLFLRTKLDEFVTSSSIAGDEGSSLLIDFSMAEEEFRMEQRDPPQPAEEYFESEWLRALFTLAVEELYAKLQQEGKTVHFFLFLRHDLQGSGGDRPPLEDLARELSIGPEIARGYLKETRLVYQGIMSDLIQSLTTSAAQFRHEVRLLFGESSKSA